MTPKHIARPVAAMAMACFLMAAGCSSLKVVVDRDAAIPIPPGSTWAWGPEPKERRPEELDPRVDNSLIHGRVKQAVERVLAQKGLRQTDPHLADFLVAYRVGVRDARQLVTQPVPVGPPVWGWGWGYYGPPPMMSSREVTFTEGALMIDVTQRSTGKLAFRAIGRDSDFTSADSTEVGIQKTVTKLLQDLT
jgi:Domain of unknown function (DUF4136)